MNGSTVASLLALSLLTGTEPATQEQGSAGIEWAPSLEAARERAARDGRPVLLYFTFDT